MAFLPHLQAQRSESTARPTNADTGVPARALGNKLFFIIVQFWTATAAK
jgi:hypothetical protein